jgi:hypothetical protein
MRSNDLAGVVVERPIVNFPEISGIPGILVWDFSGVVSLFKKLLASSPDVTGKFPRTYTKMRKK